MMQIIQPAFQHLREQILGQQPGILGKKAEHDAIEETGDAQVFALRKVGFGPRFGIGQFLGLPFLQGFGHLGNGLRQFLSDLRGGALGFEEFGIFKHGPQNPPVLRAVNLVVGELVGFLDRAVEIGLDDIPVEITHHQQRRIKERLPVPLELLVRFIQILLLALVFPAEAILFPHIGKPAFSRVTAIWRFNIEQLGVLDDALLETEKIIAGRIGLHWGLVAQQTTKVVEMLHVTGGFLALVAGPFLFKLGDCHFRKAVMPQN
ncbi:MAG: hypothetical protein WCO56_10050 [Verrucomicrobiota bacterium]